MNALNININLTAAQELIDAINGITSVMKPAQLPASTATQPKQVEENTTKAVKVTAKKESPKVEAAEAVEETKAEEEKTTTTLTVEVLRRLTIEKAQAGQRDALKAILTDLGAESLTTLDPKKYEDYYKKASAI